MGILDNFEAYLELDIKENMTKCPCGCPPDNCTCCCSNPKGCAHRQ
jgi:hypothetical protein